ncbi:MAG: hypothetical protein Q8M17_12920 [Actinomycetota bacterium]|nr:hypothetical protein [Actinomycetota bacterium]
MSREVTYDKDGLGYVTVFDWRRTIAAWVACLIPAMFIFFWVSYVSFENFGEINYWPGLPIAFLPSAFGIGYLVGQGSLVFYRRLPTDEKKQTVVVSLDTDTYREWRDECDVMADALARRREELESLKGVLVAMGKVNADGSVVS